jgi:hypothetical protein
MPSIGALSFLRVDRAKRKPGEVVRRVTRPNVSGVALQKLGTRGQAFRITAIRDYVDDAALQTAYGTLLDYQGTTQTIVNNFGTSLTGIAILNVSPRESQPMSGAVGGLEGASGTVMGMFDVDCVDTGVV